MYTVEIYELDYFARGIAKIDGKVVFVPKTLPGDIVKIEIVKDSKNYSCGQVIAYIKKVKRLGICPYSDLCGGCPLIDIPYQDSLALKRKKIIDLFKRNLKMDLDVTEVLSDHNLSYRNKVTLHVKDKEIGYYIEKSNVLVPIDKCVIAKEEINELLLRIKSLVLESDIFEVVIRSHDKLLLAIKGNIDKNLLLEKFSDVAVIYLNDIVIKGNGYVMDNILGNDFRISLHSFFQVNNKMSSKIFEKMINYIALNNYHKVLDLYCGVGIISIVIANYVKEVIGIEVVKEAINDANYNKVINDKDNVSFICDKVENRIDEFKDIDLIIVDPPRSGLDQKSLNSILKIKPKDIIYMSCNPVTLIRDLKSLLNCYTIKQFFIADMFPNTYHVECLCVLNVKQ